MAIICATQSTEFTPPEAVRIMAKGADIDEATAWKAYNALCKAGYIVALPGNIQIEITAASGGAGS